MSRVNSAFAHKTGAGNTANEIVKVATKRKHGMVIIGARGLSSTRETFLESVYNSVMHKYKIPVLIVK